MEVFSHINELGRDGWPTLRTLVLPRLVWLSRAPRCRTLTNAVNVGIDRFIFPGYAAARLTQATISEAEKCPKCFRTSPVLED